MTEEQMTYKNIDGNILKFIYYIILPPALVCALIVMNKILTWLCFLVIERI